MQKIVSYGLVVIFSIGLFLPQAIFAQDPVIGTPSSPDPVIGTPSNPDGNTSAVLTNPLSNISSIPDFFRVLIEIILVFAIPFIVFFIIYAGFLYVTAQGNPEKIKKAHMALLFALIGGMLILGANVLLDIITNTVTQII